MVVLCLLRGYKGEDDGLEWTGLVRKESKKGAALQKQDCCGKEQRVL